MPRIVEHRSAVSNAPVVEVHVQYDPKWNFPSMPGSRLACVART